MKGEAVTVFKPGRDVRRAEQHRNKRSVPQETAPLWSDRPYAKEIIKRLKTFRAGGHDDKEIKCERCGFWFLPKFDSDTMCRDCRHATGRSWWNR